jgi:methylated-DNA-[protein]-cysteine S-methyltransferase
MDAGVFARESERLGRTVQLGVASGRVISVSFPDAVPGDAASDHPLLDRAFDYLDGEPDHFDDVAVALTVPTAQRGVLDAVRKLPYGETVTVERVARLAGLDADDESDLRTVRTALADNPVPLFVPDHRVRDAEGGAPADVARTLRRIESA